MFQSACTFRQRSAGRGPVAFRLHLGDALARRSGRRRHQRIVALDRLFLFARQRAGGRNGKRHERQHREEEGSQEAHQYVTITLARME